VKYVIDKAAEVGLLYAVLSISCGSVAKKLPALKCTERLPLSLFRQQTWLPRNGCCIIRVFESSENETVVAGGVFQFYKICINCSFTDNRC